MFSRRLDRFLSVAAGADLSGQNFAINNGQVIAHSRTGGGDPTAAHHFLADGVESNTVEIQSTNIDSYSCIFAKDYTGNATAGDRWALGYGNPDCFPFFATKDYLESISYIKGVASPDFFISDDNEAEATFVRRFYIYGKTGHVELGNSTIDHGYMFYVPGTVSTTGDVTTTANLSVTTAGGTLYVKGGSNAKAGTFTMNGGKANVSNLAVTANSSILITVKAVNGVTDTQPYLVPTPGVGFTAHGNPLDASTYNYVIIESQ